MTYKVFLRNDGWFDAGKDAPGIMGVLYNSKQKLKEALLAVGTAPSIPRLKRTIDEKVTDFGANSIQGFDGRPYFEGREIRIAPSAAMPEYCVLGSILTEKAYQARLKRQAAILNEQMNDSCKVNRHGGR